MKHGLRTAAGRVIVAAMPLMLLSSADASPARVDAVMGCAPTAEAAIAHFVSGSAASGEEGFRVVSVRRDNLRARTWALVERCRRPDLPLLSLPIAMKDIPLAKLPVAVAPTVREAAVVHAGDAVTVKQSGGASRMELHGWAEESGAAGAKVHVRLPKISEGEDGPAPRILCAVVGPGQVEVAL